MIWVDNTYLNKAAKTNRGIQASWKGVHLIKSRHLDLIHKYRKLIQKPKNDYVSTVTFEFGHKIELPDAKILSSSKSLGKIWKTCADIVNLKIIWINNPISRHLCKHTLKNPLISSLARIFKYIHTCVQTQIFIELKEPFERFKFFIYWTLLVLSIWSDFERSEDSEVLSTHCTNMQSCAIEIMIMREQNNSIDIHCSFDIANCRKLFSNLTKSFVRVLFHL